MTGGTAFTSQTASLPACELGQRAQGRGLPTGAGGLREDGFQEVAQGAPGSEARWA